MFFDFLYNLFMKHFLSYNELRDIIINVSIILVRFQTWIFLIHSQKNLQISNFIKFWRLEAKLFYADGQTWWS